MTGSFQQQLQHHSELIVIGAADGAGAGKEATTFDYQYGMTLSTSFTGEDPSDSEAIETGNGASSSARFLI